MHEPDAWFAALHVPKLLHAWDDGEWSYYVLGHGEESLLEIDEPNELEWSKVWLRPIRASDLDESERPADQETLSRDERGRFASVIDWIECHADAPGAHPFLGVKYRPISESPPRAAE